MLLMLASGIGLSQVASDPRQVTLRWLRLGGIIAVALLAVAATVQYLADRTISDHLRWLLVAVLPFAAQLLTVQKGWRNVQRVMSGLACAAAVGGAWLLVRQNVMAEVPLFGGVVSLATGGGVLGGFLMTMLLGHAYLTAGGEMTQSPFRRLVLLMAILLAVRAVCSCVFGLWPFLDEPSIGLGRMWDVVMMTGRFLMGIVVPAVFTWMTLDCVNRRANQSATGILYVACVLVVLGEGMALSLWRSTALLF